MYNGGGVMAGSAPATSLGVTGCLSQTNGRAGLRPVVPERQAVAGALLGEEPLVKLAVLLDAQRALRQDAAVSWARRRRLVVGHGGRHLSGTDVTEEGSKVQTLVCSGAESSRLMYLSI
jgi:hypothetical protein